MRLTCVACPQQEHANPRVASIAQRGLNQHIPGGSATGGAGHYEIWKYCQSTSKVHASIPQNLRVWERGGGGGRRPLIKLVSSRNGRTVKGARLRMSYPGTRQVTTSPEQATAPRMRQCMRQGRPALQTSRTARTCVIRIASSGLPSCSVGTDAQQQHPTCKAVLRFEPSGGMP